MELDKRIIKVHVATFFNDGVDVPVMKLAMGIKELFSNMFPQDPQILPLPPETPGDAPRCIFQKQDLSANLTFSMVRMDFDGSFQQGTPWKNHIAAVAYSFMTVCMALNLGVKRIGVVVQALADETIEKDLEEKVTLIDFKSSDEKSMSWVMHVDETEDLRININTVIQIIPQNPDAKGVVSIDVNTHVNSKLPQDITKLAEIINILTSKIEEKLKNVFL